MDGGGDGRCGAEAVYYEVAVGLDEERRGRERRKKVLFVLASCGEICYNLH